MTSENRALIVVDAANVVGSRPDGWWRDRAGAARRLLTALATLSESLGQPAIDHSTESPHEPEPLTESSVEPEPIIGSRAETFAESGLEPIAGSHAESWRDASHSPEFSAPAASGAYAHRPGPVEFLVVLEGAARAAAEPGVIDGITVVAASGSGDDEVVSVVSAARDTDEHRQVTVVTADRGLRERVERLGASVVGPRWLRDQLDHR